MAQELGSILLECVKPRLEGHSRPWIWGISGLQGSGKSTLAAALVAALPADFAVALSLDDFYLSSEQRNALAREIHPLFATRGVPGTHEPGLLHDCLDALARASPEHPALLPRFDKGRDERLAPGHWPRISAPPRLIVLEGWCLGVPPQARQDLVEAVNWLEREEDAQGRWRGHVNAQLAGPYTALWQRIDHLTLLQAPCFAVVERWRGQQEQALHRDRAPRAMDEAALRRFIAHYERLSRHALASLPAIADSVVELDAERRPLAVRVRDPVSGSLIGCA